MATDWNTFKEQAKRADDACRKGLAALRSRDDLSAQGKAQEAARLNEERKRTVQALQRDARAALEADGAKARQAVAQAQAAHEAARRALLGDVVSADIVRRRIAQLTPAQLTAWAGEPHDDWTAAAILEYGVVEMAARVARSKGRDGDAAQAGRTLEALDAPQDTPAILEARRTLALANDAERFVNELDYEARRAYIANTFGVSAQHVPAPM